MTIPYPKREFLNDDDSDSKSSAAKVIKWHGFNIGLIFALNWKGHQSGMTVALCYRK